MAPKQAKGGKQTGKNAGKTDMQYMKQAETLLHEDLSVALGIPFDEMPFCSGLKNHVPSLSDLFDCLDATGRQHEILAWVVQNNTERQNILFTPLEKTEDGKLKLGNFDDVETLIDVYNKKLYHSPKQQLRKMLIEHDHLFIQHYK